MRRDYVVGNIGPHAAVNQGGCHWLASVGCGPNIDAGAVDWIIRRAPFCFRECKLDAAGSQGIRETP